MGGYAYSIAEQRTSLEIDIRKGFLPDGIPFNEEFGCVCFIDVLEHIERDIDSLKIIREIVSPDGYFLLIDISVKHDNL
jgi:2-polyprenyl-3-methyl-5-hydroxy-6-metoxy-1,4-benzoquinol methylase